MKKLKHDTIKIHPMTEKPDVDFKYIWHDGSISQPYLAHTFKIDPSGHVFGWIPAELEVIDDITFEELEIGEHFAADAGGERRRWVKTVNDDAYSYRAKEWVYKHANELTNIKHLKEVE
jgi:hypothetical protein